MKQPILNDRDLKCLQMGRAMMLAGMRLAVDVLREQIDDLLLTVPPENGNVIIKPSMQRTLAKIGAAPPEVKRNRGSGVKGYWARMTTEERSAEMARRYQVAHGKKPAKKRTLIQPNHPRNPNHPEHAEWKARVGKTSRGFWASLSPAKKKARLANMLAARQAKKLSTVKMENK